MSYRIHISFILPIYNVQDYLADAIESILKQSVSKEIILVNDGSTDDSLAIMLQYANQYPFIRVIDTPNQGVSAARNAALRSARGDYIFFLDPDDYLDEHINFQWLYELTQTYQVPVIKGTYRKRCNNQLFLCKPVFEDVTSENGCISSLIQCFNAALPDNWFIPNACFLIKRSFLTDHQLMFDTTLSFGEDTLFNVDLLSLEGKILEIGVPLHIYRSRPGSAMTKPVTKARLASQYRLIQLLQNRLSQANDPLLQKCLIDVISLNCRHLFQTIEYYPELEKYRYFLTEEIKSFMHYTEFEFFFKHK